MRSKTELSSRFRLLLSINVQLTPRKTNDSVQKKNSIFFVFSYFSVRLSSVEIAILIINQLKFTIMQKFIISVKTKLGQDVIPPYIVNDLTGFGRYSERITSSGLIVLVDAIHEEDTFVELPKPQDNGK